MIKLRPLAFLALLSVFMAIPGCTGVFDKCVKPVASQITWTGTATELGEVVAAFLLCDPGFSGADVPACAIESLNQLEAAIGPDGEQVVNCIIAYYEGNGSAALQARAKAVGAKRGVKPQACAGQLPLAVKDYPPKRPTGGAQFPPGGPLPAYADETLAAAKSIFAYAGESVAHAQASCEATCRGPDAIGSPGGPCLCQRRVDGVLRWVATR
jgi:hypothetical protein